MAISFGSINTGLPKDIVKQLMEAERAPVVKMEGQKEKVGAKKAVLGELIKLMEELRNLVTNTLDERGLRYRSGSFTARVRKGENDQLALTDR